MGWFTRCCDVEIECLRCDDGTWPEQMQVTISGVVDGTCTDCDDDVNGTFVCDAVDPDDDDYAETAWCLWRYQEENPTGCGAHDYLRVDFILRPYGVGLPTWITYEVNVYLHDGTPANDVMLGQWYLWENTGDTNIDIDCQLSSKAITQYGVLTTCGLTSASCSVSAV